jgi:hypothetical protein
MGADTNRATHQGQRAEGKGEEKGKRDQGEKSEGWRIENRAELKPE